MNKSVEGRRVRLIFTDDEFTRLKPGDLGTAQFYDDLGTLVVIWDSGSRLGLIPGADAWEFVGEERERCPIS